MNLLRYARRVPVSVRIPVMVVLITVAVSGVISERVLDRLGRMQAEFLNGMADTYLDGLSAALQPAVLRRDVWEVFDALDRSKGEFAALSPRATVVTDAEGRVLAATDPRQHPPYSAPPPAYLARFATLAPVIDPKAYTAAARRDLIYQGQRVGAIYAEFDVRHLFEERRQVLVTLLVTNGVLAALFALGGFLVVRRMIGPIRILEGRMRAAAQGSAQPIPAGDIPSADPEVGGLFHGYNVLVRAERERAAYALHLAEEERLASLGRLASSVAHEINNPLGGLFNAIDTLRVHGDTPGVRDTSLSLIERGLRGIREVVEAVLASYRPERAMTPLSAVDLDDLKLLARPELRRRNQDLRWEVDWSEAGAMLLKGGPVRQAVLNLLLNASAATPEGGTVSLHAGFISDRFVVSVSDEGRGMPSEAEAVLTGGQTPTAVAGHGLGLLTVRRTVADLGGRISVRPARSGGTEITLALPLMEESHAA